MVAARGRSWNNPNIPDNTYLTVSLQPRELPSRSDRNTLPSCCPRSLPLPSSSPASSSSDFCPGLFAGKPRRRAPVDIFRAGDVFKPSALYLRRPRRRVGFLRPLYRPYIRVTLYHSSAGLLSFRVMVYARVHTHAGATLAFSRPRGRLKSWK